MFGGWECKACNNLHSHFENMDVVCDECGADRVPLIATQDVQIWSPPDEQPRRSPDQRQPPEQDVASLASLASLAQKRAAAAGAHGAKKQKTKLGFDCFSKDLVENATGSMQAVAGSVPCSSNCLNKSENGFDCAAFFDGNMVYDDCSGFVTEQIDSVRTDQFLNRLKKLEKESITSNNVEGEQEQMHVLSPDSANYWREVVRKATDHGGR